MTIRDCETAVFLMAEDRRLAEFCVWSKYMKIATREKRFLRDEVPADYVQLTHPINPDELIPTADGIIGGREWAVNQCEKVVSGPDRDAIIVPDGKGNMVVWVDDCTRG